jgi:undecaprenyl-diphosphatase|uniref:phosphatase PAP2 family protein n=1 Tax=Lachnospira sp. TaxID=2049031 RepID=UPI0040258D45
MEIQILHWFESLHNPITNPIMYGITSLGNGGIFWIILAAAMLLIFPKKYRKVGLSMAIALILSLIFCNGIMKHLWARPRAFWVEGQNFVVGDQFENLYGIFQSIHDYSFPSGHSSASFAAATAIFMWRKKEGTAALILAALIAVSRLYLTVHYPSDVLVGTITGILYGIASYFIAQQLMKRISKFNEIFNK